MFSFLARTILTSRLAASAARVRRHSKSTMLRTETLEDRTVPTTWSFTPTSMLMTSVHSGDTINFAPGTYPQIIVTQSNVTLNGGSGVVVEPSTVTPVTLSGHNVGGAAIDIYGQNVVLNDFTVNGSADTDGNMWFGIRVMEGGSATIKNNTVEQIVKATEAGANVGIQIGLSTNEVGVTSGGTAKVENNTVETYEGAGVEVDGTASAAIITGNTITGQGTKNNGIAEYGVQVSNGSTARVQGNTISDNTIYGSNGAPNNPTPTSAGIFFYNESGHQSVASSNTVTGNDDGILVEMSSGSCTNGIQIVNNTVTGNYGYAGIFVLNSSNVEVVANQVSSNLTYNGVALNGSSNVLVGSNDIYSNGSSTSQSDGIYDQNGINNLIYANNSYSNSGNGININYTNGDQLFNNYTWSNTLDGIQDIGGQNDAIWLGSSVINAENGILLEGTNGDTVIGNVLAANGEYGLYLEGAKNTFVASNLVVGNDSGSIYIDSASTGTTLIANWTSTPPVKDGTSGTSGSSSALGNTTADADATCSSLTS